MFLPTDPQLQLDMYHHRSAELLKQAAAARLARSATRRRRVLGRWPRKAPAAAPACAH